MSWSMRRLFSAALQHIFVECILLTRESFFSLFDPLLGIVERRVHLDLVRGVVETVLLGAGVSQHTAHVCSTALNGPAPAPILGARLPHKDKSSSVNLRLVYPLVVTGLLNVLFVAPA